MSLKGECDDAGEGQTGEDDGERRRSGKGDNRVIKIFSSTFSLTHFFRFYVIRLFGGLFWVVWSLVSTPLESASFVLRDSLTMDSIGKFSLHLSAIKAWYSFDGVTLPFSFNGVLFSYYFVTW